MEFNALTSNTIDYDYDAIGNRIAEIFNGSTSTYAYSLTSSWLNSIDSEMLTYDQAGNMETDRSGAREFTWTPGGRLAQVEDGGVSIGQYTYDANGQRSKKVTPGSTTYFIYGAGHQLLGEYDASGDAIREYVYLNSEPLAQVNADESMLYLHSDHLGTPRVATDESANPVWSWESDAFGRGAPSGSETVNLRFPGQYYDAETALHYNWNRYYNPETGRYISSDPIGLDGGLNTYVYAEGNPTRFTDPEGLLVKATLYRRFNTLVVRDVDTGDEVFLQAFTGGIVRDGKIISPGDSSNQKPAPSGNYFITDSPTPRANWYGLLKKDSRIDDYLWEGLTRRGGFRLHLGTESHGCVTVNAQNPKSENNYKKLQNILRNTKKENISFIKGPYPWNETGSIKSYGTLTIW